MAAGVSVRALASPAFVLALVVLVLNDHVLKQAYPGVVTGKLSDVAGLVVAPLVLGVLLTAWRVPRPMPVAVALTGLGFAFAKSTATGAAGASALWSLAGVPTYLRADVTDLLALPALYAAWLVHRQVAASPPVGWRPTVARVTGVALLPIAVLASAATSCGSDEGRDGVTVVSGRFVGGQQGEEERLDIGFPRVMDGTGEVTSIDTDQVSPSFDGRDYDASEACDDDGTCWRIDPTVDFVPSVQMSTDGGRTWFRDLWVTPEERDAALAGAGDPGCGGSPTARLQAIAVLRDGGTVKVVVAASHVGLYVRSAGGVWTRLSEDDLGDLEPTSEVKVRSLVRAVRPIAPKFSPPTDDPGEQPPYPGEEESLPPEPVCDVTITASATPNPMNGPPTVSTYCA